MCSRYEINGTFEDVVLRFDAIVGASVMASYAPLFAAMPEVRPTNLVPIISNTRELLALHWGLKVEWDNKPIINARAETLSQKPTFQKLLENRCLIPATGYFEWRKDDNQKIKTHLDPNNGGLFSFAGLVQNDTFTMITCDPSPEIAHIHSRMPVILHKADESKWLSQDYKIEEAAKVLVPYPGERITIKEIGKPPKKKNIQGDLFD